MLQNFNDILETTENGTHDPSSSLRSEEELRKEFEKSHSAPQFCLWHTEETRRLVARTYVAWEQWYFAQAVGIDDSKLFEKAVKLGDEPGQTH